jgi:hypothetical protein
MNRYESRGCLAIGAGVVILLGFLGLLRACLMLLHHQTIWWTWIRGNRTWLNPWQAIVGFGLVLVIGICTLISAIRGRRS